MGTRQPASGTGRGTRGPRGVLAALGGALAIAQLVACGAAPGPTPASVTATAQAQATAAAAGELATVLAQASATANTFAAFLNQAHVIYHAPVPGPGCDPAGAGYSSNAPQHITCLPGAMRLTGSSNPQALTSVLLTVPGGFPARYIIAVDVGALQGTSAIEIESLDPGGFHALTLYAGTFDVFGPDNQPPIVQGALPSTGTIHIQIVATGQQVIYVINGAPEGSYAGQAGPFQNFGFLLFSTTTSTDVQAELSNFTVSALP